MREDSKTIIFALGICLVCSVLLSGLAAGLKKIQTANREFDVKRNIVKAFGVDIGVLTKNEIEAVATYVATEGKNWKNKLSSFVQ